MIMKKSLLLLIYFLAPFSLFSQIQYDTLNVSQIGEGVFHYSIIAPTVPWTFEVVEVDLTNSIYSLETVKANDNLRGYEKTSSMSQRKSEDGHQVIAAINGDFYGGGGIPTNLQVLNGEILRTPISREVYGYSSNGSMFINTTNYSGEVSINDTTYTISNVNSARVSNALVFYNHYFGESTGTNEFGTEITLKAIDQWTVNGEVATVIVSKNDTEGDSPVTDSTFVFSGHGTMSTVLKEVEIGDTLIVNHKIFPGTEKIKEAVGGSRKFLDEGVNNGNWPDRHPRSAIGFNSDTTKFYMVTVDGRQSSSAGATLNELADFMRTIGAHSALNLDGGGSTTLVVHNNVVNSPSDGSGERSVSNALMLVSNKSKTANIENLELSPDFNKIYRNKNLQFNTKGSDVNFFPIELNPESLTFSLSEGFGASISNSGLFSAGNEPDTGFVYVEYQNKVDSAKIIIKGVTSFNIFPRNSVTDNIKEIDFYSRANDFDGVSQSVSDGEIEWKSTNSDVGIIENGIFRGVSEGTTEIIATFDGISDTSVVAVEIGMGVELLTGFEDIQGITLDGLNIDVTNSKLTITDSVSTESGNALKLDYEFQYAGRPDTWAYIKKDIPIFGVPDTFLIDGKTDGKKHLIDLNLVDDNNEKFDVRLKRFADNTTFETYSISMENAIPDYPFSTFYFPITVTGISIKLKSEQQSGQKYNGTIYFDNLRASYPSGTSVSVEEVKEGIPTNFEMSQNYPNPFNPTTNISFNLPKNDKVSLTVFDVLGRKVAVLVDDKLSEGNHSYTFDASNISSGMYIYILNTSFGMKSKKMILVK